MFSKIAILTAVLLVSAPAYAGHECLPASTVQRQLAEVYGETLTAIGASNSGLKLEIWVGPKQSWTVLLIQPPTPTAPAMACIIDAGEGWELAPPTPGRGT